MPESLSRLPPPAYLPSQEPYSSRVNMTQTNFHAPSTIAPEGETSPTSHQSAHLNNMNPLKLRQLLQKEKSLGKPLPHDGRIRSIRDIEGHEQMPPMMDPVSYHKLTHDVEHVSDRMGDRHVDLSIDRNVERMMERHMDPQGHIGPATRVDQFDQT